MITVKVKNAKVINRLSGKSLKAGKTRNIIAIIAIILTTVLFTSLFTIGTGIVESIQQQTIRQSGGDGHGVLKYITNEQYEAVKNHPLIKEISYNMMVASSVDNPEFLKRHVEMYYMDAVAMKLGFCEPTTGSVPQKENEIITDTKTLDLLGIPHEIGSVVPLVYTIKGEQKRTDFILSGFWESDPVFNVGFVIVSQAFVEAHEDELVNTFKIDNDMAGIINSYIMFKNSFDIKGKLNKVIIDSGLTNIDYNVNWAYLSSNFNNDPATILAMLAASVLIIFTGYLIIYNIFQISVIRDIRYYGLLKTIGTTSRQIKQILHKQALMLSTFGIPIGLILGFFIGKSILPVIISVTNIRSGSKVSLNPVIFIGAALFTLATVFISLQKPGKIAAKVSPVETVRYSGMIGKVNNKVKKSANGNKLHKMALSNLGRSKKRTFIVVMSMSLSLILLNSVFTLTNGFDMDKYLERFVDTDFLIGHANYFRGYFVSEEDGLSETFIKAVEAQEGFKDGGRLYYNINAGQCSVKCDNYPDINIFGYPNYTLDNGNARLDLYGLGDLPLSRLDIIEGKLDQEKIKTGRYIIVGLHADDNGRIYEEADFYEIGETVYLTVDGRNYEYKVMAKARIRNHINSVRRAHDMVMYLPSNEYLNIVNKPVIMTYAFNVEDNWEQEMEAFVKNYTEKVEPIMNYESKQVYVSEFKNMQNMLIFVGGILCFIIGLIGILNFINSVITSIIIRQQEFAMLQSIGMTGKQLNKLLCYEGLYYAAATIILSLSLGSLFSVQVIGGIVSNMWFFSYRFVIVPLLCTYPALILLSLIIPHLAYKMIKKQSIVERLREAE